MESDIEERMEMVRDFVTESRELLDVAEPQIIDMERTAASGRVDEEILNEVFRLFHSLKGTAAFLDLQNIISVTHEAETLLDLIRKKMTDITPEHVDLLCRASDFIRKVLDTVETRLSDEGFEAEAEFLINNFRDPIPPAKKEASTHKGGPGELDVQPAPPEELDREEAQPEWLSREQRPPDMQAQDAAAWEIPEPGFDHNESLEIEPERGEAAAVRVETQSPATAAVAVEDERHQSPAAAGQPALADDDQHPADTTALEESQAQFLPGIGLRLTPEMSRRFAEESSELCDEAEIAILGLEKAVDDELASQAFRAFHSIKGNAGFFGYGDIEKLSHLAENLLDDVRGQRRSYDGAAMSVLLSTIDALRNKVTGTAGGENPEIPNFQQLCMSLEKIVHAPGLDQVAEAQAPEQAAKAPGLDSVEAGSAPPQGLAGQHDTEHGLEEAGRSASGGRPGSSHENSPPAPKGSKGQPLEPANKSALPAGSRTGDQKSGDAGDASPGRGDAGAAGSASGAKQQASGSIQQVIRVDIDKLDKLLDLVGELVIAEAMVTNDGRVEVRQDDRFGKAFLQLDKISREIQEVAMSMRMIPLAGVFRRMLRLVRDLANKANKQVELEIIGEETEVDKTIIEQISDPLVHLIRNAVDHGIESVAERQRAGKPETGRVTIEAKHSAGEVWITVEDDGGGLNREKIFRKGVEKGLIRDEDRDLKDEDIWRLIFEPGFSTAEQVSNISGRGVGMDVVRQNIEKLRGKIDIRSKPGIGTVFAIRIPLTLAIIEGMVIMVGSNRYIIPISSIKESFRPKSDQITCTPDKLEIVRIRGELLPVARLHEVYQIKPTHQDLTKGILIYVDSNDSKCCLFVDELIGQQQIVIKGLPAYLNRVKGISGCAIMGDGEVGMILDIADLVSSIERAAS